MKLPALLLLLVHLALGSFVAAQTPAPVEPPDPEVTVVFTEPTTPDKPYWLPNVNWPHNQNWGTGAGKGFDYRWRMSLGLPPGVGHEDDAESGAVYYGLFIQKVTVSALGQTCAGTDVFKSEYSYYEYTWVKKTQAHSFSDTFGTGDWNTGVGGSRKGHFIKKGVAKFIPITHEESEAWRQDPTKVPKAVEVGNGFDGDNGWNREPGADGNVPVKDADGDVQKDSSTQDAHSGGWPNRPDKPDGWDDDFGGKAQCLTRELKVEWDTCEDAPGNVEDSAPTDDGEH